MFVSVISSIAGIAVLVFIFIYIYIFDRKPFIGMWLSSLSLSLLSCIFRLFFVLNIHPQIFSALHLISFLLSSLIFMYGVCDFVCRKVSKKLTLAVLFITIYFIIGLAAEFNYYLVYFPIMILNGFILVKIGILFMKMPGSRANSLVLGWIYILFGIHKIDFPVLSRVEWFAPWGYSASTLMILVCYIGMVLKYLFTIQAGIIENEKRYKKQLNYLNTLIENMNEAFFTYDNNGTMTFVNKKCEETLAYKPEEMVGRSILEFVAPGEREKVNKEIFTRLTSGIHASYESLAIHRNGSLVYIKLNASPIVEDGRIIGGMVLGYDVTEQRTAEEHLSLQRVYFQQLFEGSPQAIVMLNNNDVILNINKGFENLFGYSLEEVKGLCINDIITPDDLRTEADSISREVNSGNVMHMESIRKSKDGKLKNVSIIGYPIIYNNYQIGVFGIYSDITTRKKAEERLKFISLHDALTGTYNRAYFEQEMQRLDTEGYESISVIMCDVDGLKLINDTLGHDNGDLLLIAAANAIKESFDDGEVIARIGGDEFAVLSYACNEKIIEKSLLRLHEIIGNYNKDIMGIPLSISVGVAVGGKSSKSVLELFKEADNNMYREKLNHTQSTRSAIVQTLIKTLEARDFLTEGHADRLQGLAEMLAEDIGMSWHEISDLRLLAHFHDIGKVGISDRILFKPGPLTEEEAAEMKRHSEIGYRIAQSAPDLIPIADWILKHHEWWNGGGYPLRLSGKDIPVQSRIISIVDAFDAMTNDRPYRKAMTVEQAIAELEKNAGIQFDPQLVKRFIQILKH